MKTYNEFRCQTVGDVQAATEKLDVAEIGKITYNDTLPITTHKGVYNTTQKKFCNVVSSSYHLVQHKEYFDSVAEALQRLNIPFNMTITQQGHKAFADVEFLNKTIEFKTLNEKFTTGFRATNSYNKLVGLNIAPRFTRLVCTNGMILSTFGDNFSVRHNQVIVTELEKFVEVKIGQIISADDKLQQWVSVCMQDSTEWQTVVKIIEKLFTSFKYRQEILKRLDITLVKKKDEKTKKKTKEYIFDDVTRKFTRWEIYNSITNYLSNGEHIAPLMYEYGQKRAETVLLTPINKLVTIEVPNV